MGREEKKYEVLPGVAIPDLKTIISAASDFSNEGVETVNVRTTNSRVDRPRVEISVPTNEDINKLQQLGNAVAEEEERSQEESRRRMEAIKNSVVTAETMSGLRASAVERMTDEQKAEMERIAQEEAAKKAEEEAKIKAREERRLQQQKALEESLALKAAKEEEAARIAAEEKAKQEAIELERKKQERLEAKKKAQEEAAKRQAEKKSEPDDEYKAWVKAKREAAIAEAKEKEANKPKVDSTPVEKIEENEVIEEVEVQAPTTEETKVVISTDNDDPVGDADITLDDFNEFL